MYASNRAALEASLTALGGLTDRHGALVAAARSLAVAVDAEQGNASLWREYRAALAVLLEVGLGVDDVDSVEFAASVRTPLRDASVA
jgi:hypothetical protein